MSAALTAATKTLAQGCRQLHFSAPVAYVYHPLDYAWQAHQLYLKRYGNNRKRAIFVGMNPGPWGMAQTGIPFGDVVSARDYLRINVPVQQPAQQHSKRPVTGFACPRREVSGSRLWALFAERYGSAEQFFADYFVINYCPLLFLRDSGANLTPDKLPAAETAPLYQLCDTYLQTAADLLRPQTIVGIGGFAEQRLQHIFGDSKKTIGRILHPSPASPAANRAFTPTATTQLTTLGL